MVLVHWRLYLLPRWLDLIVAVAGIGSEAWDSDPDGRVAGPVRMY